MCLKIPLYKYGDVSVMEIFRQTCKLEIATSVKSGGLLKDKIGLNQNLYIQVSQPGISALHSNIFPKDFPN